MHKLKWVQDRWSLLLVLSILTALFAAASALSSSEHESTTYLWPSNEALLDSSTYGSQEVAGTELLLVAHRPVSLDVSFDCFLNEGLVFKTSLHPEHTGGLLIEREGTSLRVWVGSSLLTEQPWPANTSCNGSLHLSEIDWALILNTVALSSGQTEVMPVVSSLVAPFELVQEGKVSVELTTEIHGSSPSTSQYMLWFAAFTLLLSVLWILLRPSFLQPGKRLFKSLRNPSLRPVDFFIFFSLISLMALGETNYDDGWVLTTATQWTGSGIFPQYFEKFNTFVPLGWLHDMIYLGFAAVSRNVWWLRVPALLASMGGWIILRHVLSPILGTKPSISWWAFGGTYVLGAAAWQITLRPEPLVALLSVFVLVAALRFQSNHSPTSLVVGCFFSALAITIHTSGVITLAPLIVILPSVLESLFSQRSLSWKVPFSALAVSFSVFVLFVFVDTDLSLWSANREAMAQLGSNYHQLDWTDEFTRYDILFRHVPYNSPVRLFTVLLGFVVIILHMTRPRKDDHAALDLISRTLLIGYLLLFLTPSKWPWHFGALVPFLAAGLAVEIYRSALHSDRQHLFSALRFAALSIFIFMTANPNAYDFVPSIWSWMGMATALSFVGTIGKIAWLGRKLSTSLFTALSAIILYQTFSQTLFFFLLALLIWAAISRISLQPQKLLLDTARLLPVLFLVVTSTDLVIAWFREKMYAPGGVQKVFDGINAVLPLNQIALFIFLLLIAIKVASKRKNIQLTPSAFTKPAAYLILISSLVFTGALTWNGAHQTEWSTPRQGLWGAAGLSPCGLPATLGYHDPNLASVLQEITDFETPSVYLPNSTQTLATIQAPNKATNSIAGAPNASGASFGTYHLEMEEEATGWFATPWYFIPSGSERLYFEAVGRITPDDGPTANQIELQYGILSGGEVTDFSSNDSGVSLDTVRWQTLEAGLSGKWNAVRAIGIDRQTTSWLGLANFRVAAGKLNLQAILDEGHYGNQAWISPRLVLQFPCLSISNMRQGRINSPGLLVSYQYIKDSPFEYMFDVYDYSSDTIIRGNLLRFKLRGPDWIEIPFSTRSHWS